MIGYERAGNLTNKATDTTRLSLTTQSIVTDLRFDVANEILARVDIGSTAIAAIPCSRSSTNRFEDTHHLNLILS